MTLPDERSRVCMSWQTYLAFLEPNKRDQMKMEFEQEWGKLPPVVEIHNGEVSPIWDDDPRFTEGM